jgi:hypothetical protein
MLLVRMQNVRGLWVLLLLGGHAAAVLLLARCSTPAHAWRKLAGGQASDARLLLACMVWPGAFTSDATDRDGRGPSHPPLELCCPSHRNRNCDTLWPL